MTPVLVYCIVLLGQLLEVPSAKIYVIVPTPSFVFKSISLLRVCKIISPFYYSECNYDQSKHSSANQTFPALIIALQPTRIETLFIFCPIAIPLMEDRLRYFTVLILYSLIKEWSAIASQHLLTGIGW